MMCGIASPRASWISEATAQKCFCKGVLATRESDAIRPQETFGRWPCSTAWTISRTACCERLYALPLQEGHKWVVEPGSLHTGIGQACVGSMRRSLSFEESLGERRRSPNKFMQALTTFCRNPSVIVADHRTFGDRSRSPHLSDKVTHLTLPSG
jgi:hypothetical protein